MINDKYISLIGVGMMGIMFIGLGMVACTDGFDAMNTPEHLLTVNEIDESLFGQAFAQAQHKGMLGNAEYQRCYQFVGNLYSQIFEHPGSVAPLTTRYVEVEQYTNACWETFYNTPAPQQHFVETFTEENNMPIHNAFAKIWRVQMYHRMTDYWGPIIYSEFGNGETSVAYDSQEEIYLDFFETLDEAVATLEQHRGGNAFGIYDMMYEGDVDSWIRFANSLRLRLALRISYVEPDMAKLEAEKAVNSGVFEDNSQQADLITNQQTWNWLSQWTYGTGFRMSATMESILVGYEDPRLSAYWQEAEGRPGYHGIRNGLPAEIKQDAQLYHSGVSVTYLPSHRGCLCGENPPNRVMNTAEVYFLRAEGALRGWDMGGPAEELYNQGIRASLEDRTTATDAEITDYINSTNTPTSIPTADFHPEGIDSPPVADIPVLYQADTDFETQLEQIITQKWISLFPDGWELWSERRRTGYPVGYKLLESQNDQVAEDELMRRSSFATDERSTNNAAVEAAEALLNGPDNNATRLWWDAKPLSDFPTPVD